MFSNYIIHKKVSKILIQNLKN